MDATEQERTSVDVDPRALVQEAVAGFGFSVELEGGALRLRHKEIPEAECAISLPLRAGATALELRARHDQPLVIRVYVGEAAPPPAEALIERALGVFAVRLRALGKIDVTEFKKVAAVERVALAGYGITGATAPELRADADPLKVVQYATTADAANFESATALILDGLLGIVLPLGSRLTGTPVPDGMLLNEMRTDSAMRGALYDCKSKKNAARYDFKPEDGDQFARYREILERCRKEGWQDTGLLVATSDADAADLHDRMGKEIWKRLEDRRFIVAPAQVLLRWHQLASAEGPAFRGRIDVAAAWDALWEQSVAGIPQHRLSRYFPSRGTSYRVLSVPEAEVIWLAGAAKPLREVATAFAQLQGVSSVDRIEPHKRPHVVRRVIKALGEKDGITIGAVAAAAGLTELAVEYLLDSDALGELHPDDMGDSFVKNRKRLLASIRAA